MSDHNTTPSNNNNSNNNNIISPASPSAAASSSSSSSPAVLLSSLPTSRPLRTGAADTVTGSNETMETSEIIIRPDGKKVRRVVRKKTVQKEEEVEDTTTNNNNTPMGDDDDDNHTTDKLDAGSSSNNSTATPHHSQNNKLGSSSTGTDNTASTSASAANSTTAMAVEAAPAPTTTKPAKNLGGFLDFVGVKKRGGGGGSKSVDGDFFKPKMAPLSSSSVVGKSCGGSSGGDDNNSNSNHTEDAYEIYIRPDGKKVRRVKRTIVNSKSVRNVLDTTDAANDNLNSFLTTEQAIKKTSAATVSGASVSGISQQSGGEVYINAYGKKVRRVVKRMPSKTKSASGLEEMQLALAASAETPRDDVVAAPEYEVYRRADGKLVRRVKKPGSESATGSSLEAMIGSAGPAKITGAATVGGDRVLGPGQEIRETVEIYVRADGKKVRRIKKVIVKKKDADSAGEGTKIAETMGQVDSSALGEIYINAQGKKVRRVKRVSNGGAGDLSGVLNANKQPTVGAATVAGEQPSKQQESEGVIYIRADGKKVRRVKKTKAAAAVGLVTDKSQLAQMLAQSDGARSGAATVAGDQVARNVQDGEIIIRADGKKVLRRKKAHTPEPEGTEVYRRADGKLVRRIKRALFSKGEDTSATKQMLAVDGEKRPVPTEALPVAGDVSEMQTTHINGSINTCATPPSTLPSTETYDAPSTHDASSASFSAGLTEDEEAMAQFYRKKLKMGMSIQAVRHKMAQDGIAANVTVAVCGVDVGESSSSGPANAYEMSSVQAAPPISSGLTEDEEAMAQFYRKKAKMGMPIQAVRHKMAQDGVAEIIIAAVCGIVDETSVSHAHAPETAPTPAPTAQVSSGLSEDEEAMAQFYRKKIKLGMSIEAVRHKMDQDGVADTIITAVCGGTRDGPANTLRITETSPSPTSTKPSLTNHSNAGSVSGSVAYAVVRSDDPNLKLDKKSPSPFAGSLANLPKGPEKVTASDERSLFSALSTDKFEVKVTSEVTAVGSAEAVTKYMTLDELAKISGQSKTELEALVLQKRENSGEPPAFVLQPQDIQPGEALYPVSMMKRQRSTEASPAPLPSQGSQSVNIPDGVSVPALKPGEHLASIKDGQEVVSASLASAARAIAPLGDDLAALLEKLQMGEMGELMKKLQEAEKRQKKLEKQLAGAGIQIAEDIDYFEALEQVGKIAKRMNEIGGSDVTCEDKEEQNRLREEYFKLEQEMERYNTALMISEEYQVEQERKEKEWEEANWPKNLEALKMIRRHMPVNIRSMSEAELTGNPSPNGKFLPAVIAKKFKRTNVLQILRLNPDDIERMHPSTLENMRVTGLTLTERRALYAHLKILGPRWEKNKAEKMSERKWTWFQMMKNNFKENLVPYDRHVQQYGPAEDHPYATRESPNEGCPLIGKQCPIKSDLSPDYRNDYGWTDAAEYEISNVTKSDADDPGAKAMAEARELAREKKANERADLLKKHYKGKLLQVSKANGSCESMDEAMDKMEYALIRWIEFRDEKGGKDESDADKSKEIANFTETLNEIKLMVLDFALRSGMQTSGKRQAGGDKPDIRSSVEASLSEEVIELSQEFFKFVRIRMNDLAIYDTRTSKTIELLEGMFNELHEKNIAILTSLKAKRSDRSRKLKTIRDCEKEVEEKKKNAAETEEAPPEVRGPPMGIPAGAPGRGGLLDGIKGRGGRGGLLDGIKGRGRGGNGPPGRGDFLDAIKGRGDGGRGAGPPGRVGLLDAIKGRGEGRGAGPSGRGGLLDAIKARGGED